MVVQEQKERKEVSTRHGRGLCDRRGGRGVPGLGGSRVPTLHPEMGKAQLP